ncbi:MAG: hypothetical protein HQ518_20185 [Rhodopirellula sp.]|nr:hypothetical protein [Rhodopirellula sp.]
MTGFKQSGMIGAGILLIAATGLIAMADDIRLPGSDTSVIELPMVAISPAPAAEPLPEPVEPATSIHFAPTCFSQCESCEPSRYARFKARCRAKFWGYPEYFCEPPLGSTLMGHTQAQIANGQAARMALYQYDFVFASDQLNARGKAQLAKIARWLPSNAFPVFVEPTPGRPGLDAARRQVVWHEISSQHFSIPFERVVVGRPNVRGLDADDALSIDRNRSGLTYSRGAAVSGGGASTSSSTTTGSSNATSSSNTMSGATGSTGQ